MSSKKPPLGIIPRQFHNEQRFKEIREAIIRYYNAGLEIRIEWVIEYNELVKLCREI